MQIAITRFPGFCKMVERAIAIAESAAEEFPDKKVYTLGRLAHNDRVSERLSKKGISVALSPEELTAGDVLVISAHGAPPSVYAASAKRGIIVRDATCPNIVKIHDTIKMHPADKARCGHCDNDRRLRLLREWARESTHS